MSDRKTGRNADGTFTKGNSGKPKGTRHKATLAAMAKQRRCPVRRLGRSAAMRAAKTATKLQPSTP